MVLSRIPTPTQILLAAGMDAAVRAATIQCYACTPTALPAVIAAAADRGQPADGSLLQAAATIARARWGHDDLIIDAQVVEVRPGVYPGIPVWSTAPDSSSGEVLIACLADEPLLEFSLNDVVTPAARDCLLAVPSGTQLRFRNPTLEQQVVVVLLLRPRDGLRAWNLPRHCARVFAPNAPGAGPDPATLPAWSTGTELHFHSRVELLAPLPHFSEAQIAAEPLFNGASVAFARATGGPLMQAYLDRLPAEWYDDPDLIIMIKRDELSPGWAPALLEWHMDGTSRCQKRSDGTPDLRDPVRRAQQLAACIGRVSPTGLLDGKLALPEIPVGTDREWGNLVWRRRIHEHLARGAVRAITAPCDQLFLFGWGGFHCTTVARGPGWRCFIKTMRGRGDIPANRMAQRSNIAWPSDGATWPSDPLGVFPQDLPL